MVEHYPILTITFFSKPGILCNLAVNPFTSELHIVHESLSSACVPGAVRLWFTRMFDVPAQAEGFPVVVNGRTEGRVVVVANPLDEVAEIWDELKFLAALLFVLAVVIVALLVWSANLALRPIRDLTAA